MAPEHFDVLIVGAGLSGIGAAVHLKRRCPGKTFAIVEARDAIGGTWDLFRYPGVRSDSDMFTLAYSFRPWKQAKAIADGRSILEYVRDTARAFGIERLIRFGHRVTRAAWSSADARWTVELEHALHGQRLHLTCGFLYFCTGYYRYDTGYLPDFPGRERFAGTIVHPQHWPDGLDVAGRRVVVIGSGATAVTLVPALAEKAAHVTMLQRSPSYVLSVPSRDVSPMPCGAGCPRRPHTDCCAGRTCSSAWRCTSCAGAGPSLRRSCCAAAPPRSCRRTTRSICTSSRATTRGSSGCAWCPTATCSSRCAADGHRSPPTASTASPSAAFVWSPAASSPPTSSSPPPAWSCRRSAVRGSRSTAVMSISPRRSATAA